jgi:hypothetical protein
VSDHDKIFQHEGFAISEHPQNRLRVYTSTTAYLELRDVDALVMALDAWRARQRPAPVRQTQRRAAGIHKVGRWLGDIGKGPEHQPLHAVQPGSDRHRDWWRPICNGAMLITSGVADGVPTCPECLKELERRQ